MADYREKKRIGNNKAAKIYREKISKKKKQEKAEIEELIHYLRLTDIEIEKSKTPTQVNLLARRQQLLPRDRFNYFAGKAYQALLFGYPESRSLDFRGTYFRSMGKIRRELLITRSGCIAKTVSVLKQDDAALGYFKEPIIEGVHKMDATILEAGVVSVLSERQPVMVTYRRTKIEPMTDTTIKGEYIRINGYLYPCLDEDDVEEINFMVLFEYTAPKQS